MKSIKYPVVEPAPEIGALMHSLAELLQVVEVVSPSLEPGSIREGQITRAKLALTNSGCTLEEWT